MPAISRAEAVETLAGGVEKAKPGDLAQIYSELFPEQPLPTSLVASNIAEFIRSGIEPEEIVDLWNVEFPNDRHVWYNEEQSMIHRNEEMVGYVD